MKRITQLLAVVCLGVTLQANAIFLPTIIAPPSPIPQSANPTEAEIIAALNTVLAYASVTDLGDSLYKSDGGGTLFSTSIVNTAPPAGEQTATLTYNGGSPAPALTFIIVKDGQAGYTIWDAAGWNGSDTIQVDNSLLVVNKNGTLAGISHIEVWGNGGTTVPDASTSITLLGMTLLGVESLRRRMRK